MDTDAGFLTEGRKANEAGGPGGRGEVSLGGGPVASKSDEDGSPGRRRKSYEGGSEDGCNRNITLVISDPFSGTQVATSKGEKPIEQIQPGDLVWSQSDQTGEIMLKRVKRVFANVAPSLVVLHCGTNTLEATPEHPLWVVNQGWKAVNQIQIGDYLWTQSGESIAVTEIEHKQGQFTVYNMEVEDAHTYFVGHLNILAHNSGRCNWSIKALSPNLRVKLMKIWEFGPKGLKQLAGSVSTIEARELAEGFVGPNFTEEAYQGTWVLKSEDGLRQVRGPVPKSGENPLSGQPYSRTGVQMNFEQRTQPSGRYESNVHLDVRP